MAITRVLVKNSNGRDIDLALFPPLPPAPFREDEVIEDTPSQSNYIELSVEDVCKIARTLIKENVITPYLTQHDRYYQSRMSKSI